MKFFLFLFSLLFLFGCTTLSVPEHNLVALNHINEKTAYKEIYQYNNSIIQKANIINSTIFTFKGRSMTALGITKLDGENKNFSVAGFNPMGITLFKIQMENDKVISSYVIPQFGGENLDKAASMISKDIARIYFNRKIDLQTASLELDKYNVTINTQVDKNDYKYIFSGQPLKLTTKSMYKGKKKIWSVDYYDYKTVNNKTPNQEIPFKIFLKNYKYRYVLEIETKDIK
ncbi:MAG: DUF3261 domain-containing protein [Desulfobacteraceae bacterium]|nr:DUF3261 domain-containing protein [Desulfobacteraceae bacterium]